MSSPVYYLGRKQKVYGPLSSVEIDELRKNGQIENYTWIWKPEDQAWTVLDAAPANPPVVVGTGVGVTATEATAPAAPRPRSTPAIAPAAAPVAPVVSLQSFKVKESLLPKTTSTTKDGAFRAILFDGRNAVTAWVSEATADGCEIHAQEQGPDPFFVQKASAMIHLHEVATDRSTKIPVKVSDVFRRDQHWVYRVRWTSVPAIFAPSQAA
jgi:hypothetical protein